MYNEKRSPSKRTGRQEVRDALQDGHKVFPSIVISCICQVVYLLAVLRYSTQSGHTASIPRS
jgi:hypothetical protein